MKKELLVNLSPVVLLLILRIWLLVVLFMVILVVLEVLDLGMEGGGILVLVLFVFILQRWELVMIFWLLELN